MATKSSLSQPPTFRSRHRGDSFGGAVLGSRGEVLVSDSSYAHHHMSPRALRDAKFSPGLGQQEAGQGSPQLLGRRRVPPSLSGAALVAHFRRPRYDEEAAESGHGGGGSWGAVGISRVTSVSTPSGDEDDDFHSSRVRGFDGHPDALVAQAAAAHKAFSPRALRASAEPTVPRAADAARHQPGGGGVKIFSAAPADFSHVKARVPAASLAAEHRPKGGDVAVFGGHVAAPIGKRHFDHVAPKVPTAEAAREYKPGGGNVSIPSRAPLRWDETASPTVPSAASAASYRPRAPTVSIFSEKVSFGERAQARGVPVRAREAALYKPRGGEVDVFQWQKSPATRREPPQPKTDMQLLEEMFPPGHQATAASQEEHLQSRALAVPISARRRRGQLAM